MNRNHMFDESSQLWGLFRERERGKTQQVEVGRGVRVEEKERKRWRETLRMKGVAKGTHSFSSHEAAALRHMAPVKDLHGNGTQQVYCAVWSHLYNHMYSFGVFWSTGGLSFFGAAQFPFPKTRAVNNCSLLMSGKTQQCPVLTCVSCLWVFLTPTAKANCPPQNVSISNH